jgi:3-oxoacyl-[acyl-carrier-protein] synthase-3
MKLRFLDKEISGFLSVVPKNRVRFEDEIGNYALTKEKMLNLKQIMGFDERRIVAGGECGSDLVTFGLEYLFGKALLDKQDIGALVVVTQTPDHLMPATSCIIHGRLGLSKDVLCFDINQGCTGFLYGLIQSCMLLDSSDAKKVVLCNCDTLSRRACPQDRNIFPLIGDAGTITVFERSPDKNDIQIDMKTDGTRSHWLTIPAGGFRKPSSDQTREIHELSDGIRRSEDDLYMNGPGIFTFTQTEVPATILEYFRSRSISMNDIDYFIFHQPNRFMLDKLAKKLGIPAEKIPMNIVEKYGNASSATIPVTICHNLASLMQSQRLRICFAGFGVGLSWGVLTMKVGPLRFCEILEK